MKNPNDRCTFKDCGLRWREHDSWQAAQLTGQLHTFVEGQLHPSLPATDVVPAPQPPADATITSHPWLQYTDPDARGCLHQERPSGEFCGRPRSAHAQPAGPPVESRSAQKRKAIMRGEEMPTFTAGPPVTGDGDYVNTGNASIDAAYAAGLARGRALGARDEREAIHALAENWCDHAKALTDAITERGR